MMSKSSALTPHIWQASRKILKRERLVFEFFDVLFTWKSLSSW